MEPENAQGLHDVTLVCSGEDTEIHLKRSEGHWRIPSQGVTKSHSILRKTILATGQAMGGGGSRESQKRWQPSPGEARGRPEERAGPSG